MDWGNLFFGFSGRTNRAKFWIAALVYGLLNAVLFVLAVATDGSGIDQAINGMLGIVFLISGIAVGIKRLHDRNRSGWYLLLFYVAPVILAGASLASAGMEDAGIISGIFGLLAVAVGVWAFVDMGCLRGSIGVNQYGADPVAPVIVPPIRTPV